MKKKEDNFKILFYIKNMEENLISRFEKYSKIYSSIIELDMFYDDSENLYNKVRNLIKDKTFNIYQNEEDFNLEYLIHLKNRIHLKDEKINEKNIEIDNFEEKQLKLKFKILIFFKNLICNLEIIDEYIKILRTKGSNLPIKISIKTKIKDYEPSIIYYLNGKENNFKYIRTFLLNAKNNYLSQLNSSYKEDLKSTFFYGKQFRNIINHLESDLNIDSFLRYILNNKDNNKPVLEGFKSILMYTNDYVNKFELYIKSILGSISSYITTVFEKNGITLKEHFNKMEIKSKEKGIYLFECENNSMEISILNFYWDKLRELPIAQNILFANEETSPEEIQGFLYRAILCNYNVLFIIEINDSFSDYQQGIMNGYITDLISEKYKKYKEQTKEYVDKRNTKKYLDSCIIFIYEKKKRNIISFLKEIKKYNCQYTLCKDIIGDKKDKFLSDLGNIKVITSDICGLGKSEKIKKIIKDENKKYYYFPLGGLLSKNILFNKLKNLLNKIKNEIKEENYKEIAIHLDLTISNEISIINEFLISFLNFKFYKNKENIIYIPKDISIYIEMPNCFENYLSKFCLLNAFPKENIALGNIPPFNFSKEVINIFERILGINSNIGIEQLIKKYFHKLGIEKYSYYQINIFIKLFISQFSIYQNKLIFTNNNKDISEKCFEDFFEFSKYFIINGGFYKLLTGIDNNNDNNGINYIDKISEIYNNNLKYLECPDPLIFLNKDNMIYSKLNIPTKDSKEKNYLKCIKEILNLPNEVEKDIKIDNKIIKSLLSIIEEKNNKYVITFDNFKKIILLIYRIKANIPVILMGETGCGKTSLIIILNKILNNGEINVKVINIHPGIIDEKICDIMEKINKLTEKQKDKELWIFFDEMNTCPSLSLLTEIFLKRNFNGKKLNDNIRLIGACNPYRRRRVHEEKCGLSKSGNNDDELVYFVHPLPLSLLNYVFIFGSINDIDEKKYIYSIIERIFKKDEKYLHEITTEIISECHKFLRNNFDYSIVSLREISRFLKCIEFFQNYFTIKNNLEKINNNEKNNKIRSIICSIYICYYLKIIDYNKRNCFENKLRPLLLNLINNNINGDKKGENLKEQIKDGEFKKEILKMPDEIINNFSDFLRIEEEYLINKIDLDKGIGKNTLLKENVFLIFLSVVTKLPLIIIGKPGSSKSLSLQLINKSMKGIYSKNQFFRQFPKIIQTYFKGSQSTQTVDIENLYETAKNKLNYYIKNSIKDAPISMILFDEIGLAERSISNPLEVLNSKFDYLGKEKGISFVGISNYSFDEAKLNKALILYIPDLDKREIELIKTSYKIVESVSEKLKNDKIFETLSKTYFNYKKELQIIKELTVLKEYFELKKSQYKDSDSDYEIKSNCAVASFDYNNYIDDIPEKMDNEQFKFIKEKKEFKDLFIIDNKINKDFHGNCDFYNLIKGIAIEFERSGNDYNEDSKLQIIEEHIERNFGGINYEICMDFNLKLDDINENIQIIKSILNDYTDYNIYYRSKLNSSVLFKAIYNLTMEKEFSESSLIIKRENIYNCNLNKCINDNIKEVSSRFLLLEVKPSLTTIIYQIIKLQNPYKEIIIYDRNPFEDYNSKEYILKLLNQIQENVADDKLIIIDNIEQIHPFLFDL